MSILNTYSQAVGTVTGSTLTGRAVTAGQNNTNNFSAKEIKRQSDRLKEQSDVLLIKLGAIANICEDISSTVKSEDSNLAVAWMKVADTFNTIKSKYANALSLMIHRMAAYSAKSIVNEEVIEKGAKAVGNVLEDISSFLQNIDL